MRCGRCCYICNSYGATYGAVQAMAGSTAEVLGEFRPSTLSGVYSLILNDEITHKLTFLSEDKVLIADEEGDRLADVIYTLKDSEVLEEKYRMSTIVIDDREGTTIIFEVIDQMKNNRDVRVSTTIDNNTQMGWLVKD